MKTKKHKSGHPRIGKKLLRLMKKMPGKRVFRVGNGIKRTEEVLPNKTIYHYS